MNQFWKTSLNVEFSSNEAYLYFFLLNECNNRGWENPFECPNKKIILSIGISEPTLIDCRNRLQQKGLLLFEPGKRKAKSPVYYLNDLSKPLSKTLSKNFSKTLSKNFSSYIRDKTKDNNNSNELFPEQQEKKCKPSKKKAEFIPPSLEEVKTYFENKLPDWEQQADTFYNHFTSLGWRTASGVKVERWDSRANLWITDKKLQSNGESNQKDSDSRIITITANQTGQSEKKHINSVTEQLAEWIDSIPIGE